jgi:proteasome lid subunit RPN8/RPN11
MMPRHVVNDVLAHAREAAPDECCGLLIGAGDRVVEAVRARNLSSDPNRFLIDPHDHIAARRNARTQGSTVVGFYHSHPHSEARPSPTDLREAAYPECVHLIVSLVEEPAARLFRMNGSVVEELALELDD